jgi:hypothetical protein
MPIVSSKQGEKEGEGKGGGGGGGGGGKKMINGEMGVFSVLKL